MTCNMMMDIEETMAALKLAIPTAQRAPCRPAYHFCAPARSIGDPHGPIFFNGFYHLFYQFNPVNDELDCSYWGHARSGDLLHWEHLPVAISPSKGAGEARCFSGCPIIARDGRLTLLYTSIGPGHRTHWHTAQQWLAQSDQQLIQWKKYAHNPVIPETIHGDTKVYDWRDPYAFMHQGEIYVVCGGNLNQRAGGQAVVTLYRAANPQNTQWQYLGIVFVHPNKDVQNLECPNLFPLHDKWVLVLSPHSRPEYFIGTFNPRVPAFVPENHGLIECGTDQNAMFGTHSYAPYCFEDRMGRRMLWSWVYGATEDVPGFHGCLSLPRELSLDHAGSLCQKPADILQTLRTDLVEVPNTSLDAAREHVNSFTGDTFEMSCVIDLQGAKEAGITLCPKQDERCDLSMSFDGSTVTCGRASVTLASDAPSVDLQIFFDHSIVEIFIDHGRKCITEVIRPEPPNRSVFLYAHGGPARFTDVQLCRLTTDGLFSFASEF